MTESARLGWLWHSPTGATWLAHASRSLGVVLVLPLALAKLSAVDAVVWLLFETVASMMVLADFGLAPTFIRAVAYGVGGAARSSLDGRVAPIPTDSKPNWETLTAVIGVSKRLYLQASVAAGLLLLTLGTLVLSKPLSAASDGAHAWAAWGVMALVSTAGLWGESYAAYLQGMSLVPLYRRWQAVAAAGSAMTAALVLLNGGGLLGLTVATQVWVLIWIAMKAGLCRRVFEGRYSRVRAHSDPMVTAALWPSTWRSGVGLCLGQGAVQGSALLYAQLGPAPSVGAYLLGVRLLHFISGFSRAPFYSRLPEMATLYAQGARDRLVTLARGAMGRSHWTFVSLFLGTGVVLAPTLEAIGSETPAPSDLLWAGLGLAFLAERYGAMHIQLYSLTNRIVWHIANGVAGCVFIASSLLLLEPLGVFAFPFSLLLANAGFYAWYSARHSYREFELTMRDFDLPASHAILLALTVVVGRVLLDLMTA